MSYHVISCIISCHIIYHISYFIFHISYIIYHISYIIYHKSYHNNRSQASKMNFHSSWQEFLRFSCRWQQDEGMNLTPLPGGGNSNISSIFTPIFLGRWYDPIWRTRIFWKEGFVQNTNQINWEAWISYDKSSSWTIPYHKFSKSSFLQLTSVVYVFFFRFFKSLGGSFKLILS